MADVNLTLSVITLNTNRLNTPIKSQKLAEWMRMYAVCQRRQIQRYKQVESKRMRKYTMQTITNENLSNYITIKQNWL